MHAVTVEETNEATVERVIKIPRESAANEEAGRRAAGPDEVARLS